MNSYRISLLATDQPQRSIALAVLDSNTERKRRRLSGLEFHPNLNNHREVQRAAS